jgi:hypothetical protein
MTLMNPMASATPSASPRVVVNLGSGEGQNLPSFFDGWRQLRVDVDPSTRPDLVASMTDLSALAAGSAHGVWASHCLEHLYRHEVTPCLREIRRVLTDRGFLCLRVPDLQTVAQRVAEDRLTETIYQSGMGPVSAHDVIFGFGQEVAQGKLAMAHRTGFTPSLLVDTLKTAFESSLVRRRPTLELVAVARKGAWSSEREAPDLLDALGL